LTELEEISVEEKEGFAKYPLWSYLIALGIFLILMGRVILARKKYGKLRGKKKRRENEESKEKEEKMDAEENEANHLEKTIEIIKKHDGRITQKELRKEMMYLSEAKISLILTELEHKGQIEKIKKGRGNVIVLK
jgi:uncharacterized membrane protein